MTTGNQSTTLYGSPYMAEFYELRYARDRGLHDVEQVYWPVFKDMYTNRGQQAQFTFLDVGTGSGRAVFGLLNKAVSESFEIASGSAQLIGMDIEQHMLDYARKEAQKYPGTYPVTWALGSALELEKLPPLADQHRTVDLLIFTYGSIVHLKNNGDLEQFLDQLSRTLTPGTGRAYISFYGRYLVPHGQEMPSADDLLSCSSAHLRNTELKSVEWPDIHYRMETAKASMETNIYGADLKLQVVRADPVTGGETVLESSDVQLRLRVYTEDHVCAASKDAGLRIVDRKAVKDEVIFVLQKSP